jgi:hypothetical protein
MNPCVLDKPYRDTDEDFFSPQSQVTPDEFQSIVKLLLLNNSSNEIKKQLNISEKKFIVIKNIESLLYTEWENFENNCKKIINDGKLLNEYYDYKDFFKLKADFEEFRKKNQRESFKIDQDLIELEQKGSYLKDGVKNLNIEIKKLKDVQQNTIKELEEIHKKQEVINKTIESEIKSLKEQNKEFDLKEQNDLLEKTELVEKIQENNELKIDMGNSDETSKESEEEIKDVWKENISNIDKNKDKIIKEIAFLKDVLKIIKPRENSDVKKFEMGELQKPIENCVKSLDSKQVMIDVLEYQPRSPWRNIIISNPRFINMVNSIWKVIQFIINYTILNPTRFNNYPITLKTHLFDPGISKGKQLANDLYNLFVYMSM